MCPDTNWRTSFLVTTLTIAEVDPHTPPSPVTSPPTPSLYFASLLTLCLSLIACSAGSSNFPVLERKTASPDRHYPGRCWDGALEKTPTEIIGPCLYPSVLDLILARPSKNGAQSSTRTQPLSVRPVTVRILARFAGVRATQIQGNQNSDRVSTGAEGSRQSG